MAVDVCSEISSLVASPRISFSYDLNQTDDVVPIECRSDALLLDFTTDFDSDFDFGITTAKSSVHEISSADELFSNGKILPTQTKKHKTTKKEIHGSEPIFVRPQPSKTTTTALHWENTNEQDTKKKRLKEFLFESSEEEEEEKPASKSFWQFKRSASLNCDNGPSKGLIRSLQILARSNSTGSAPNSKQTGLPKVTPPPPKQQHSQKQSTFTCSNQPVVPPFSGYNYQFYNSTGRPPSLKNCRSYSSGVRIINPILNIPPSYISKGKANLFGFGSFFCNGKSKRKRNDSYKLVQGQEHG